MNNIVSWINKNRSRLNPAIFQYKDSTEEFEKILIKLSANVTYTKTYLFDKFYADNLTESNLEFLKDLVDLVNKDAPITGEIINAMTDLTSFIYRTQDLAPKVTLVKYTQLDWNNLIDAVQLDIWYFKDQEFVRCNKLTNSWYRVNNAGRRYGWHADSWYTKRADKLSDIFSGKLSTTDASNEDNESLNQYKKVIDYAQSNGIELNTYVYGFSYQTSWGSPQEQMDSIVNIVRRLVDFLKSIYQQKDKFGDNLIIPKEDWYIDPMTFNATASMKFIPDEDVKELVSRRSRFY